MASSLGPSRDTLISNFPVEINWFWNLHIQGGGLARRNVLLSTENGPINQVLHKQLDWSEQELYSIQIRPTDRHCGHKKTSYTSIQFCIFCKEKSKEKIGSSQSIDWCKQELYSIQILFFKFLNKPTLKRLRMRNW